MLLLFLARKSAALSKHYFLMPNPGLSSPIQGASAVVPVDMQRARHVLCTSIHRSGLVIAMKLEQRELDQSHCNFQELGMVTQNVEI
jgi:hypothetical protein